MIPTVEPSAGASEKTTMEMQYIKSDTLIIIFMILDQTHTERSCMYRFKSKTNEQPCWRPAPFQRRRKWQICEEQLRLKRIASYQNCGQPKLQWTCIQTKLQNRPVFNQNCNGHLCSTKPQRPRPRGQERGPRWWSGRREPSPQTPSWCTCWSEWGWWITTGDDNIINSPQLAK